jgi:hypothetical protein
MTPSEQSESYTPLVPDTVGDREYMPIVIVEGKEYGARDLSAVRSSYAAALELGAVLAANVGRAGLRGYVVVLTREVPAWEECRS